MALEIEVALGRDGGYDARAVFRRGSTVTVGTRPSALLVCGESGVPDLLEVLEFQGTAPSLRFRDGMAVEVNLGGALRDAASLVSAGLVVRDGADWVLGLDAGAKVVVTFGGSRLLVKVVHERPNTIWDVGPESDDCGGCGTEVPWAVRGGGALTPCPHCRQLTRFAPRTGSFEQQATASLADVPSLATPLQASEIRPTEPMQTVDVAAAIAAIGPGGGSKPAPGKAAGLPTYDGIAAQKATGLPTYDGIAVQQSAGLPTHDGIAVQKAAGLPTHDGIQAQKAASLPTYDGIAAQKAASLPTHDGIQAQKAASLPTFDGIAVQKAAALPTHNAIEARPGRTNLAGSAAPGAELPTFDSIQAFKAKEAVSTLDAMVALRQDSAEAEVRRGPTLDVDRAEREARAEVPTSMNLAQIAPNPADISQGATREVPVQLQPSALDPAASLAPPPTATRPATAPVPDPFGGAPVATGTPEPAPAAPAPLGSPAPTAILPSEPSASAAAEEGSIPDAESPSGRRKRRGEMTAVKPPTTRKVPIEDTGVELPAVAETEPLPTHDPTAPITLAEATATSMAPGAHGLPGMGLDDSDFFDDPAPPGVEPEPSAAPSPPPRRAEPPPAGRRPDAPDRRNVPAVSSADDEDDDEYDENYDDFLMGRSDGGIGTSPVGGWGLIALGLVAGAMGVGLLVYALLS